MNDSELIHLITTEDSDEIEALFARARKVREDHYGKDVYVRGLIEFTNYCKNDCYYCGLRRSNKKLKRYRLSTEEILNCCRTADKLGIKTFVLQGGEDPRFTGERLAEIVRIIRREFPDHAITLSAGERSKSDCELFFGAGVDRYLLRQETASWEHYATLHPPEMSLTRRMECLFNLKEIGYQTGAGFMVGSPGQTPEHLLADIRFLERLQPQMVGIGPFIPHKDTPFAAQPAGSLSLCLKMLAITRIILPRVLLPATTAMQTITPDGRESALNAGANVVMPNMSPAGVKELYSIYSNPDRDRGLSLLSAKENFNLLKEKIVSAGYLVQTARGDAKSEEQFN